MGLFRVDHVKFEETFSMKDFDNFIYLLYTHHFSLEGFYGSQLKTPYYPKISSETLLPDEHLTDWNRYMIFKHREL
jgi:hypothetical protein